MTVVIDGSTPVAVSASAVSVQSASFTPPAGSLVVALCSLGNGLGIGTLNNGVVTDTLSGSWKLLKRENPTASTAEVFCRDGTGSAMRVTYTSTQNDVLLRVLVLTGALSSASQPGATALSNGTAYTVAITVTTTGSLVVGAFGRATNAQTLVVNGVTTALGSFNGADGDTCGVFRQTANGTPGSVTVGYSNAVSATNSLAVAEILPSAGGPTALAEAGHASDSWSVVGPTTKLLGGTGNATDTLSVTKGGGGTGKYAAGYYPIWAAMPRLINVNQNYRDIILFEALPVGGVNGDGSLQWDGWDDTNGSFSNRIADIAACRARGQKIIMGIGGDTGDMNFSSRAKSQICIDSIKTLATALGGIDGIDWDNYETVSPVTAEYVWMGQQLKTPSYFGSSFIIQSAVGAWRASELTGFFTSLFNGGALDYVMPMYYGDPAFTQNLILNDATDGIATWATAIGGDPRFVIGFGIDDTDPTNYMTSAEILSTWNAAVAVHPTIGGAVCWNIYTDITQSSGAANSVATGTMAAVLAAGDAAIVLADAGAATDTFSVVSTGVINVAFDAATPAISKSDGSQLANWNHTVTGSNTLLLVCVGVGTNGVSDANTVTVTYNSLSLTSVAKVHTNNNTVGFIELFKYAGPPVGTHAVAVTVTGTYHDDIGACAFSFNGVHQTTPLGTPATNYGYSGSAVFAAPIPSAIGNMVAAFHGDGGTSISDTMNNGTECWSTYINGSTGCGLLTGGTTPGAATVNPSFTFANEYWAIIGVNIQRAPSNPDPLLETGTASDKLSVSKSLSLSETGGASDKLVASLPKLAVDRASVTDNINVRPSVPGIGGYLGGYLAGYVQGGIVSPDGMATTANTGLSQTSTQLGIVMPACQSGSVVVIGGGLRINGVSSGAAICTPPGTVIERAHLQRDAVTPAELFVWTWISNGTTPTYTFAFTGPAGNTGYAISLVAQGYVGVDTTTPIASLALLAEASAVGTHTTSVVTAPATTSWGLALFADRNSSSWTPIDPLVERADTAGGVDCASVELCDTDGSVTAVGHSYSSTGTAVTAVAVMALGYLNQAVAGLVNVTFSDVGHTVDSVATAAVVRLGDAGAAADSEATTTTIALSDVGSGAETYAASAAVVLIGSGSSSDLLAVASPRAFGDSALVAEDIDAAASVLAGDVASVSEDVDVAAAVSINDAGVASEDIDVTAAALAGDIALTVEDLDVAALTTLGDSASVSEDVDIAALTRLGDSALTSDAFIVAAVNPVADAGTGAMSYVVAATAALSATGSGVDGFATNALTQESDVGTAADNLNVAVMGTPVLLETSSASDAFNVAGARPTFDNASSSEDMDIAASNLLNDNASTVDDIDVTAVNLLNDIASVLDDLDVAALSMLSDNAAVFETFNASALTLLGDSVRGSDTFSSAGSNLSGDNASVSDTLQVAGPILLGDNATSSDTLSVIALSQLIDGASAFDALNTTVPISLGDSAASSDAFQVITLKPLGDSAAGADTTKADAAVSLIAGASVSDAMQLAGGIRMLPKGIGLTTILVSGGSVTVAMASGMTSTIVRTDNSQSGAAPQGNRGNSSAVVQ